MVVRAVRDAPVSATLNDARLWAMLGRTVALSLSATALASLLGAVTGYCLGATSWYGKTAARTLLILPLAIPPYFHAIAWTTLLRPRGFVSLSLAAFLGVSPSTVSESVYSFCGAAVILALAYFPITMLFCEKSLALASPSLSEAARVFGANPWQTFRVARWPFLRFALASSAMITFLLASAELGVPTILKVRVFNFEVFTRLGAFNDVTSATLLTLPLVLVGALVVLSERRFTIGGLFQAEAHDVQPPMRATRGQAWVNRATFATAACVILAIPFGSVLADGWNAEAMTSMWILARRPAINTLRYAAPASALITVFAFALAWINRNAKIRRAAWTDWLLIAGFAVPGTILALALLALYDQPGVSRWVTPAALVIAALVVRYLIVGYRIVATAVAHIPDELVEAPALDGAGPLGILWHVVVPLTRVAVLASLAVTFVLAAGEIGATILLYPPGGETLPIALYGIEANSPHAYVSAMTILQLLILLPPLAAIALLVRFVPE
ncbi:MAG: ABC transporter permease subunit [Nitrospiraceae bacterium]|nr:ABC transporter permease subunit [Nitrospiraceae bacterium]